MMYSIPKAGISKWMKFRLLFVRSQFSIDLDAGMILKYKFFKGKVYIMAEYSQPNKE